MKYSSHRSICINKALEMAGLIGRSYFKGITRYTIERVMLTASNEIWVECQYKGSFHKLSEIDLIEAEISK